jgi:hypothetical protein
MSKHISKDIKPALEFLWKFTPKLGHHAMTILLDPLVCKGELFLGVGEVKQMGETELRDDASKALFKKYTDDVLIHALVEMKRHMVATSGGCVRYSVTGGAEETVLPPKRKTAVSDSDDEDGMANVFYTRKGSGI